MMPTIPHISAILLAALLCHFIAAPRAKLGGKFRLHYLMAASDGERIIRHLVGDRAAGADIGAGTHGYGRHQRDIGADEGASTDVRAKLLEAVVVARDRAGANVGAGTDRAV